AGPRLLRRRNRRPRTSSCGRECRSSDNGAGPGGITPLSHSTPTGETPASGARRARSARGLYLITPDEADIGALLARVRAVLPFAIWLQYRNKAADPALRREQLQALLPACRAQGVALIENDDWRLAAESGADGVHLGEDDGAPDEARAALGA